MMTVLRDPALRVPQPGLVLADWSTRASFSHPLSAERWRRSLEAETAAESNTAVLGMYAGLVGVHTGAADTYISIGAGDGLLDSSLIPIVGSPPTYISVDISAEMCRTACANVGHAASSRSGIVTDFEDNLEFLSSVLDISAARSPFVCCTSVLGNLDLAEFNFFQNLVRSVGPDAHILLSFGTGSFGRPLDRSMLGSRFDWESLAGLLSCGVAMHTGENVLLVERDIGRRLNVRPSRTDVPLTESVELWDDISGAGLMHFRRYEVPALVEWVRQTFPVDVLGSSQLPFSSSGLGVACVLLRTSTVVPRRLR